MNDATNAPLLAYQVTEDYEGGSAVVFAASAEDALRLGAAELDMEDDAIDRCERAPHFDEYLPGPVPRTALLAAGWWFECSHCGRRVTKDGSYDPVKGETVPEAVVVSEDAVYCDAACRAALFAYQRRRAAAEQALVDVILVRYPAATRIYAHVYADALLSERDEPTRASWASFHLPGLQHRIAYHFARPTLGVHPDDVQPFVELYASPARRLQTEAF